MKFKNRLSFIWAGALLMVLSACSSSLPSTAAVQPGNAKGYLLTVKLSQADEQQSLAQRYAGEIIAWQPQAGFAILKLSNQAAAALQSRGVSLQATLSPNSSTTTPEASAQGFSAWAGGFSAWAGGWSAWAGGSSNLPTLPSGNRYMFMQTKLPQGQALSKNFGAGIKVAVIDTGIDLTHPMFSGRLAPSIEWRDYVDGNGDTNPQEVSGTAYGHGTGVAGLILQTAPKATILPIRVLGPDGSGEVANVVSAMSYAVAMGANIINLSLGTSTNDPALQTMVDYATSQGVYVVASAGNSGDSNITYPAAWAKTGTGAKYLLSVGSVDKNNKKSSFSSSGTALELLAPGENLISTYPGDQIASFTGTSFAAPQVSGALALALSDTAQANKGNLESYLFNSDTLIGNYGLINVAGLLQQAPDFQRKKALLVMGTNAPNGGEKIILARLENLGYSVTSLADAATAAANTVGQDVVVVSGMAKGGDLQTRIRDVRVPVVVMQADVFPVMGMTHSKTSSFGTASNQLQVRILDSSHPLSAALTDTADVYAATGFMAWGVPGPGATIVASLTTNTAQATIFAYNPATQMVGLTAPARRVGFFVKDARNAQITQVGGALFDAAVTWAVSGN